MLAHGGFSLIWMRQPQESNADLYRPALETLRTLIRTSTSSMTSVPKPLKFLHPHYPELQGLYETWPKSQDKSLFADILSVLAMTYSDTQPRGTLRYRLLAAQLLPEGSTSLSDPGSWGHEYVRHLAAELSESDVRAEMKEHDSPLYRENAFEVFFDPDDDGENYLELEVNALNTTFDLLMSKPYQLRGKADERWELAGMRTAVHVEGTLNDSNDTDKGWTAEIAIPWTAMKELTADALPPKPGAKWRVYMARVMTPRADEGGKTRYATWSPINEASLHVPPRWGWVEFSPAAIEADTRGRASTQPAQKSP